MLCSASDPRPLSCPFAFPCLPLPPFELPPAYGCVLGIWAGGGTGDGGVSEASCLGSGAGGGGFSVVRPAEAGFNVGRGTGMVPRLAL